MKLIRDLTDDEIKVIVNKELISISPTDAIQFARALFDAAWIKTQEDAKNGEK